ncbi:MAG: enoyl-CoA hydratase/isomerase family protein, partial [Gammaproteobacteria bacterium]|nr:enoyl-CoA hydratase/isomerase family protein [Gammaproteobacteria bacterium]
DQHAQFGLVPGWGGSQRLPRIVGVRRALDLLFTAKWLSAEEAREYGLVNYVVDETDLRNDALAYCEKIASRSQGGIAMMKQLARQGVDKDWNESLDFELSLAIDHLLSDDVSEGLAAFEGKRQPRFS